MPALASTTFLPSNCSLMFEISRPTYAAGNSENVITPSAESSTGQPKNSPPGMFAPTASTSHDPDRLGRVEAIRVALHARSLGVPVEQDGAVEEHL